MATTYTQQLKGTSTDPELTPAQAMAFMRKAIFRHTWADVTTRWSSLYPRVGRHLVFHESAMAKLAATMGYIVALDSVGTETAQNLAFYLTRRLDYLATYGGGVELAGMERPAYRVVLYDDGTFGGFNVAWYGLAAADQDVPERSLLVLPAGFESGGLRYRFQFNGGLLFHGFDEFSGGAPTFAVRVGTDNSDPWSIHT